MTTAVKGGLLHRAVPSHLGNDAVGLARRVFRSGRDGRHTLMFAALSVAATPLDLVLQRTESERYRAAAAPELPQVFVCGSARSGTTLVASSLIRALPVTYFTNVTAVFPRSPIAASDLLRLRPDNSKVSDRSLYGRSAGWRGASDALPLWDRWLGGDRHQMPPELTPEAQAAMTSFFGAYETWSERSVVAKNNSLNAVAHLVAETLPRAHFICVDRDPVFLAQSLLEARAFIYGDTGRPYGLAPAGQAPDDPVDGVIDQVRYHRELADLQVQRIGADRFWIVDYDEFCRDPNALVERVSNALLDGVEPVSQLQPFAASRRVRIDAATFERLERELGSGNEA
jgi:hypothetical protein